MVSNALLVSIKNYTRSLFIALENFEGTLQRIANVYFVENLKMLNTRTFGVMFQTCHGT